MAVAEKPGLLSKIVPAGEEVDMQHSGYLCGWIQKVNVSPLEISFCPAGCGDLSLWEFVPATSSPIRLEKSNLFDQELVLDLARTLEQATVYRHSAHL